jgi:hypothetical protein
LLVEATASVIYFFVAYLCQKPLDYLFNICKKIFKSSFFIKKLHFRAPVSKASSASMGSEVGLTHGKIHAMAKSNDPKVAVKISNAIRQLKLAIGKLVKQIYAISHTVIGSMVNGIKKASSIQVTAKFTKGTALIAACVACILLTTALLKNYGSFNGGKHLLDFTKNPSLLAKSEDNQSKNQKVYVANNAIIPRRKAKHLFRNPIEIKQRTVSSTILGLKADSVQRTTNGEGTIQIGDKLYSVGAIVNDHPRLKLAKITTNNVKFLDKYGQIYKRKIEDLLE